MRVSSYGITVQLCLSVMIFQPIVLMVLFVLYQHFCNYTLKCIYVLIEGVMFCEKKIRGNSLIGDMFTSYNH